MGATKDTLAGIDEIMAYWASTQIVPCDTPGCKNLVEMYGWMLMPPVLKARCRRCFKDEFMRVVRRIREEEANGSDHDQEGTCG